MTEQEQRLAAERAEIAARVANFRATQQRFEREREEYFTTTLQNARGIKAIPFWSRPCGNVFRTPITASDRA
jgi:chorismate mutase